MARARAKTTRKATAGTKRTRKAAAGTKKARKAAGGARKSRPARKPASTLASAATKAGRVVGRTVAAVADRMPWNSRTDAVDLLERDHRRLESLLKQGENTTENAVTTRKELLDVITRELNAHELIEEKILYPALKPHAEAKDLVLEGYQEHHVADLLVKELHTLARSDERWGAKLKVLQENIEHHIEEEEKKMFPSARSVFSRVELEDMAARMEAMKADAMRRS